MKKLGTSLWQLWIRFGNLLGWINSRIILGILFFVILTPLAILRRLSTKPRLDLEFKSDRKSYFKPSKARDTKNFEMQF